MSKSEKVAMDVYAAQAAGHPVVIVDLEAETHADRLAREQRYADQVALYTHFLGGSLIVDEAWAVIGADNRRRGGTIVWNPKGLYGPPVDPTHPENRYGTLAVDRCLAAQNSQQAGSRP